MTATERPAFVDVTTGLDQVGIIVRDLDTVREGMKTLFRLEPRSSTENEYKGSVFQGKPVDAAVGVLLYDVFGIELEFLCPRTLNGSADPNVWQQYLDEHGEGIHHVRFAVTDHDSAAERMSSAGISTVQSGDSVRGAGVKYAYFDTRALLGFFIETLNTGSVRP